MKKEQFKNLIESVQSIVEGRRDREEEYANFPTAAEMGRGSDPMGYDDPAAVQSGLFKRSTPVAPHSNVSTSMGSHPAMVPTTTSKEPPKFGWQLTLPSYMPHRTGEYSPKMGERDPVIKDRLHDISSEAHQKAYELANQIFMRSPETFHILADHLVKSGVDPKHPHIVTLRRAAEEAHEWNRYNY